MVEWKYLKKNSCLKTKLIFVMPYMSQPTHFLYPIITWVDKIKKINGELSLYKIFGFENKYNTSLTEKITGKTISLSF